MQFGLTRVRRLGLLPLIALLECLFLGAGDDAARVSQLGHQMMCACGCNQILLECNHVGCAYSSRMRGELENAVSRGDSDNDVLQWFVQNYGTTILAAPTKTGFNRVAWIMPFVMLGAGLLLASWVVLAWRRRQLVVHPSVPAPVRGEELNRYREQVRRETDS
jgi:cytochrome c-type biogenesis protein CcmH